MALRRVFAQWKEILARMMKPAPMAERNFGEDENSLGGRTTTQIDCAVACKICILTTHKKHYVGK